MQRNRLRILAVSCATVLLVGVGGVGEARANSISVVNSAPANVGGLWTYLASQVLGTLDPGAGTSGSLPHGTFITIYDFVGYIPGTDFAPSPDWVFSYPLLGLTPTAPLVGVVIVDDPSIGNLLWEYTGVAGATLPPLSAFGARSTNTAAVLGYYSTQDRSSLYGTKECPTCDESVVGSNVLVPVPDSGSTVAFLGLGLIAAATIGRKILR